MKTEINKLPRGQVELTIELSIDEYQPFLEQAAKTISEVTKIPGFRPGKAGLDIVKQKVGEDKIWQEALEPAVRKTFLQALDKQKLPTVGSPEIDVIKLAPGNPVIYKAKVNLLPKVELGDLTKIKVSRKPVVIKPEEISQTISNIQKSQAKESLVSRPAQKGDKVEIDFSVSLDQIPIDQGQSQNFPLVIGEKTFIPGFEEQLIGLKSGEEKKFSLEFPKNYHQKNLAGRLADFKVKLNAVYNLELPKLDDDFAKSLGQFQTVKDLEEGVKNKLTNDAEFQENQRLEEEIIDAIINQSKFDDIPDLLINTETKKMLEELEQSISQNGLKFEDYLSHLKKTQDELLLDFVPQAIKRVKGALILRQAGELGKIQATEEDIAEEIKQTKVLYQNNPEISKQIDSPAYHQYLKNILTGRKTMEYLKSLTVK